MKIRTQFTISLAAFILIVVITAVAVFSLDAQVASLDQKQQVIDDTQLTSYALSNLEYDYLIHGDSLPVQRWNNTYYHLAGDLDAFQSSDPDQQAHIDRMVASLKELRGSFDTLVALKNRDDTGQDGVNPELLEFSTINTLQQTEILISTSEELSQEVRAETREVVERAFQIIVLLLILFTIFVVANYLIGFYYAKTISELEAAAARIGSGDLDVRVTRRTNDELGLLADEFNTMVAGIGNAEKALRESEEKFRGIFNMINDGLHIHEVKADGSPGRFLEVNDVACRMVQYTREELFRMAPLDLSTEYHSKPLEEIFREQRLSGHSIFETELRRKDGVIIPVEINTHRVILLGTNVMVSVVRDISERKRAEVSLMRVNRKLNVLSRMTRLEIAARIFTLRGYLELFRREADNKPGMEESLRLFEKTVKSIQDVTEFAKIYQDLGKNPPRWQSVQLTFLYAASHLGTKNILYNVKTGTLEIYADPFLEMAFQVILEHSFVHDTHVTSVNIRNEAAPDGMYVVVKDDGEGIPAGMKDEIFTYREEVIAGDRKLFFARDILEITGIGIHETGEPGHGVRFEIFVPHGLYREEEPGNPAP